jgi:hypothetical protein
MIVNILEKVNRLLGIPVQESRKEIHVRDVDIIPGEGHNARNGLIVAIGNEFKRAGVPFKKRNTNVGPTLQCDDMDFEMVHDRLLDIGWNPLETKGKGVMFDGPYTLKLSTAKYTLIYYPFLERIPGGCRIFLVNRDAK